MRQEMDSMYPFACVWPLRFRRPIDLDKKASRINDSCPKVSKSSPCTPNARADKRNVPAKHAACAAMLTYARVGIGATRPGPQQRSVGGQGLGVDRRAVGQQPLRGIGNVVPPGRGRA